MPRDRHKTRLTGNQAQGSTSRDFFLSFRSRARQAFLPHSRPERICRSAISARWKILPFRSLALVVSRAVSAQAAPASTLWDFGLAQILGGSSLKLRQSLWDRRWLEYWRDSGNHILGFLGINHAWIVPHTGGICWQSSAAFARYANSHSATAISLSRLPPLVTGNRYQQAVCNSRSCNRPIKPLAQQYGPQRE